MNVVLTGLSSEHLTGCEMHSHPDWEMVVFLRGSGLLRVGDQSIRFSPGMIVCQPPDIPHGTAADGEYQDMYIRVDGFVPFTTEKVPVLCDDADGRFQSILRILYEVFHKREENWRPLVTALWDALYQLLKGWNGQNSYPPAVEAAVREMVLNISNPDFSLSGMIERSGYCPDHFRRCFRTSVGQTPAQYMIRLRMEHAKRILQSASGSQSIHEAALLSGYRDPYYFSKLFKRYTGMNPTEYIRRQYSPFSK